MKISFGKNNTEANLMSASFFISRPPAKISEENSLRVPAVKAAVELISNSIAQLPIYLYEEHEDNSIGRLKDDREFVLNEESNRFETAQTIKKKIITDYLLRGKAYLYNDQENKLHHLPAKNVVEENYTVDNITVAKRVYKYHGLSDIELTSEQVIEIDSGTNGLLFDSATLFTNALDTLEFQSGLMKNSAIPTGVLKATSRLTEPAIKRLRESWNTLYTSSSNAGKTILLEEGLDYKPLALNANELQLNDVNKALVSEICRVFNIPESMINSTANKYASNEANQIQFLQNCLGPIITSIESSLNKNLLTKQEKIRGCYFRFDTSEILRTTETERVTAVASGLNSGIYSFNEARAKLDLKKSDNDYFVLSLGNVLRSESGELTILNVSKETVKPKEEKNETRTEK